MKTAIEAKLRPLRRRLGTMWFLSWALCVLSLGLLAIFLKRSLDQQDLDARLSIYATATYGLAWVDREGHFHDEVLRLDEEILEAPFDIWIVEPGNPVKVLWQPLQPRFPRPQLGPLAEQILAKDSTFQDQARTLPGSGLRLQTAQIFQDGEENSPRAAVLVLGDPNSQHPFSDPFVQRLAAYCLALLLGGFALGNYLARRNLQPVVASFEEREHFLAAAAHELRTPLATLKSIAEAASSDEDATANSLQQINRLATATAQVVDDLLLFAQLDSGTHIVNRQRVRLDLLVESTAPETLQIKLHGGEIEADVDPNLFSVLLRNLFANAVRHGAEETQRVHIYITAHSLVFQDNGPGFPHEVLSQLANSLTFVSSHSGIGLGLTIMRLIVNQHGGSISLSNAPTGGARIEIQNF